MSTQSLPIVPFGKYKGKPVTDLLADPKYLEWCKQQSWFEKYQVVYNICVNQTISSNDTNSKTPAHNKLQILFSDNKINAIKLLRRCIFNKNGPIPNKRRYDFRVICEGIYNWDIIIENISTYKCVCDATTHMECECDGSECDYKSYKRHRNIYIEIKPLLGEDYPAVKRKMDTQITLTRNEDKYAPRTFLLLIKEFNAESASKEQLITYFRSSGITVVFIDDLFDILPSQTTIEHVEEKNEIITFQPIKQKELEDENKLLNEKLSQAEEKIKQLEKQLLLLTSQPSNKQKTLKQYFGKK